MFRFADTYVFLQRGTAYQDGASGDVLSLAQKGVGQFVIFVDDVDAVRAELDQAHVATISAPADRAWGNAYAHARRSGRLHLGDHARVAQQSRPVLARTLGWASVRKCH
jgi:hypothetical protein